MKANRLVLVFATALTLIAVGCAKKDMGSQGAVEKPVAAQPQPEPEPQTDTQAGADEKSGHDIAEARNRFLNEYIHFDFDSAVLRPEALDLLQNKARWLRKNADVLTLVIEGHCDERGTQAYNMALGEKRADAVRRYMIDMGLDPRRFQIMSYGEERPLDAGRNEKSWSKNRRAAFVLN